MPVLATLQRLAEICIAHSAADRRRSALDVGCAVGGSAFGLSESFDEVRSRSEASALRGQCAARGQCALRLLVHRAERVAPLTRLAVRWPCASGIGRRRAGGQPCGCCVPGWRSLRAACGPPAVAPLTAPAALKVVGLDFSNAFVTACQRLAGTGSHPYRALVSGQAFADCTAKRPEGAPIPPPFSPSHRRRRRRYRYRRQRTNTTPRTDKRTHSLRRQWLFDESGSE